MEIEVTKEFLIINLFLIKISLKIKSNEIKSFSFYFNEFH